MPLDISLRILLPDRKIRQDLGEFIFDSVEIRLHASGSVENKNHIELADSSELLVALMDL